jgi:hypothetical protein
VAPGLAASIMERRRRARVGIIVGTELSPKLVDYLRGHRLVYVATVDDAGWPDLAPISWVTAVDPKTIRMAIDSNVATVENIARNGRIRLSLLGGTMSVTIKGSARVVKDRMESIPVSTAMIEVAVTEVKDDAFWGRADDDGLALLWSQRRQVASDIAIVTELRGAAPA